MEMIPPRCAVCSPQPRQNPECSVELVSILPGRLDKASISDRMCCVLGWYIGWRPPAMMPYDAFKILPKPTHISRHGRSRNTDKRRHRNQHIDARRTRSQHILWCERVRLLRCGSPGLAPLDSFHTASLVYMHKKTALVLLIDSAYACLHKDGSSNNGLNRCPDERAG